MTIQMCLLLNAVRKSFVGAIHAILFIGISSIFALRPAAAMSEVNQMEVEEILVENTVGSLHCEIVTHSVSQSLEMKALVWSNDKATGSYSFIVTKQGVSGRSNVAQSGLFEVEPSERRIVGSVMVNASQGDRYFARLSVRAGGDEVICDTAIE